MFDHGSKAISRVSSVVVHDTLILMKYRDDACIHILLLAIQVLVPRRPSYASTLRVYSTVSILSDKSTPSISAAAFQFSWRVMAATKSLCVLLRTTREIHHQAATRLPLVRSVDRQSRETILSGLGPREKTDADPLSSSPISHERDCLHFTAVAGLNRSIAFPIVPNLLGIRTEEPVVHRSIGICEMDG